jgi:hypothetical protein
MAITAIVIGIFLGGPMVMLTVFGVPPHSSFGKALVAWMLVFPGILIGAAYVSMERLKRALRQKAESGNE